MLKEWQANCTLNLIESESKYKYLCQVNEETANINQIKVVPDFNFATQENVILSDISPLAKIFMDNIMTMKGEYDDLITNSTIYILDNSTYHKYKYNHLFFNISGEIKDPQPKLDNKNLTLMINFENDEKIETKVNCTISNNTRNNYTLNCQTKEKFKSDLESAVSMIDDGDILLINFLNINDSMITFKDTKTSGIYFRANGNNNLSTGSIIGIIIPLVLVLAIVVFTIYYLGTIQKNKQAAYDPESSRKGLKTIHIWKIIYN